MAGWIAQAAEAAEILSGKHRDDERDIKDIHKEGPHD
jgi:hypothetical protein